MTHSDEKAKFYDWLSSEVKTPPTQAEFAKEFNIGTDTLTRWKREYDISHGLKEDPGNTEENFDIISALKRDMFQFYKAIKMQGLRGNTQMIKLILEITGEIDKKGESISDGSTISRDLLSAISELKRQGITVMSNDLGGQLSQSIPQSGNRNGFSVETVPNTSPSSTS